MKLISISVGRYNGGVRAKRMYGSSTLTDFVVYRAEDEGNYDRYIRVEGVGGKTPSERARKAREKAEPKIAEMVKIT